MRQVPSKKWRSEKIRRIRLKTKKGIALALAVLALASTMAVIYASRPASAAAPSPGTVLADYCVSTDPIEGVGVGFDGTFLYYLDDPVSGFLHKITSAVACPGTLTTTAIQISGCNPSVISSADGPRFWAADGTKIYLVNVGATTATCSFQFDAAIMLSKSGLVLDCGKTKGCAPKGSIFVDGLNYDNADNSLWYSPDATLVVYHFSVDPGSFGQYVGSFRVDKPPNDLPSIPSPNPLNADCKDGFNDATTDWNSGLASGGDWLYLSACKNNMVYKFAKDGTRLDSFPRKDWWSSIPLSTPALSEDLECDSVNFKTQNTDVLWERSTTATGNVVGKSFSHIIAYAVPQGTCGFGGGFKGQNRFRSTYTAKWICNTPDANGNVHPGAASSIGLVPGEYQTDINIHNPNPGYAFVTKKFVMSLPEPPLTNGVVNTSRTALLSTLLGPDNAMFITCSEILKLFQDPPPAAQPQAATSTIVQPQAGSPTTTSVSCVPSSVAVNQATTCNATVTDTSPTPTTPTGTISFTVAGVTGSFTGSTCSLTGGGSTSSCSVSFTPSTTGTATFTASYSGDPNHNGSTNTSTITVNQSSAPDFSLTASPSSVSSILGSTSTSTISVTPLNGFTGTVSLSTTPPAGISCSLAPSSVTGSGSASLSCTPQTDGQLNVTVTGASGSLSHSTVVTFTVPTPVIHMLAPTSLVVEKGSCSNKTITISSGLGFDGTVTLQTTIQPSGLTPTFVQSNTATITVTVTPLAPATVIKKVCATLTTTPGSYTETITGVGTLKPGETSHQPITANRTETDTVPAPPPLLTAKGFVTLTTSTSNLDVVAEYSAESYSSNSSPFTSTGISLDVLPIPAVTTQVTNPCSPNFSVSTDPAQLSIMRPTTGVQSSTSNIATTSFCNFSGQVTLTASPPSMQGVVGMPPTVSLSFSTLNITPGDCCWSLVSVLTVTANKNTSVGSYSVMVTVSAGAISHSASIQVNVT